MKNRIVIDIQLETLILISSDVQTNCVNFNELNENENDSLKTFINLLAPYMPNKQKQTLKKAVLNNSIIVILSNDDVIISQSLSDLNPIQAAPLNELLSIIGREQPIEEITYTKATNIMCINGIETSASNLGSTTLLDSIEAVCLELLNY